MNQSQTQESLYTSDQELERTQQINNIKEIIFKLFYALWPSVNRVLSFFFYHILRVIKGFFKVALEQFRQGV